MLYSFSRLNLYKKCPLKWLLRYIEKRLEEVTEPLALGKATHKAIEQFLLGKSLEESLIDGMIEADFFPFDQEEYRKLMKAAPVMQGEGTAEDMEVEKYFELPLSDEKDAPILRGYIDVFRQTFDVCSFLDWKTNRMKYRPKDTMQLPLYAWAISKMYNVETVQGTLFFLRYKKRPAISHVFALEEMDQARQWALQIAKEIEKKVFLLELYPHKKDELFPATPSAECKYCPFALECYRKSLRDQSKTHRGEDYCD